MTELEKLRAARESWARWQEKERVKSWLTWLDSEIARLSDPHAEAKEIIDGWERFGTVDKGVKVREYVRYIESELAKAKAAAEPLDPKQVLTAAAKICNEAAKTCKTHDDQAVISTTANRLMWLCGIIAEPYEVQE
jgi:hypothetical protein